MRRRIQKPLFAAVAIAVFFAAQRTEACNYHRLLGLPEPTGIWPDNLSTSPSEAVSLLQAQDAAEVNSLMQVTPSDSSSLNAYVTGWDINTTGLKGKSSNTTINAAVSTISADVQEVAYTSTNVYIKATGIPDYNIGPFGNDPNLPANDNATFDIPRNPSPATTHAATGLGAIGVLVNGVDIFNMSDGNSYQNQGVWHNNAGVVEAVSFDANNAHPQQQGVYHNHEFPVTLESELGASSTNPVVIGYAIDGYPILNDYASLTPGGSIEKMMSGYELKTYTNNMRGNGGPPVNSTYVDGYFEEDYQYVANQTLPSGEYELDQYNGAFVYTPQFPNGTYAYFATTDATNTNAMYPYMVGPDYYGTPSSDDLSGTVTVPSNAVLYSVPEPSSLAYLSALGAIALFFRWRGVRSRNRSI